MARLASSIRPCASPIAPHSKGGWLDVGSSPKAWFTFPNAGRVREGVTLMFKSLNARAEREKRFRTSLLALLAFYPGGLSDVFSSFPKVKIAHKLKEFADLGPEQAALRCAQLVLVRLAERFDAEAQLLTATELRTLDWEEFSQFARDYFENKQDSPPSEIQFSTTIFAMALVVGNFLLEKGVVEQPDLDDITQDVFGALDGLDENARLERRIGIAAHKAFGLPDHRVDEDDDEPFLEIRRSEDLPPLSGKSFNIEFVDLTHGRIMIDDVTREHITERRSLTQEDLMSVPMDSPPYRFATLRTHNGELVSCITYGPDSEIIGDMRAFWWSFAATEVRLTDLALTNRFTPKAMRAVCTAARAAWKTALEHDDLESMRDMPSYRRNFHFEAMSNYQETLETEHEVIGARVAKAMLMAVQSEDRILERHAFSRFREFLWLPGEEPDEFQEYL